MDRYLSIGYSIWLSETDHVIGHKAILGKCRRTDMVREEDRRRKGGTENSTMEEGKRNSKRNFRIYTNFYRMENTLQNND